MIYRNKLKKTQNGETIRHAAAFALQTVVSYYVCVCADWKMLLKITRVLPSFCAKKHHHCITQSSFYIHIQSYILCAAYKDYWPATLYNRE